jgi:hypothetical protein
VFTTAQNLTISSAKWYISYSVHNSPQLDHVHNNMIHLLLFSQHSITWPCPETNDTLIRVFTAFHYLTMFSAKWHFPYCVHNSPKLHHILNKWQLIAHFLLCSQQSITWSCPKTNNTLITVITTVQYFNHVLSKMTHLVLCLQQSTTWSYPQ